MLEARTANSHSNADEVFLIAPDAHPPPEVIEQTDLSALAPSVDIPHIDSVKHACNVLETLLSGPSRTLNCIYKLDGLQFGEMRSSVLHAGIVVLAVRAGHHAIIAPISTRLPAAHWRSEFIFRAIRGIHLLKPELSEQELLRIVTREIHFYTQHASSWYEISHQKLPAALAG